jgi:hypothetical protein
MSESSKEKETTAIDKDGRDIPAATPAIETPSIVVASRIDCDAIIARNNTLIARRCAGKANALPHAGEHVHSGCKCSGGGGDDSTLFLADLIVLIDTSGSMSGAAAQVSAAAEAAVKAAKANCNVDLRIAYMGVEGTWPGTAFTTDYLVYLKTLLNPDPVFSTDTPATQYGQEEGANAIEDLSKYYDWRPDACRAIFYISDEELDSISPLGDVANEALAVSQAVAAANANKVTVFAHHLTYQNRGPAVIQNYKDLCNLTGGKVYFSAAASEAEYKTILAEAICGSCGLPRCEAVTVPKLEPCISINWGDSKCDCFETDDTEVICVTVCNCYSNISFGNFRIASLSVTLPGGGAVPLLPDGTPSVQIVPTGPVCYGDIPPCRDDKAGCISREFVVRTRGAKGGKYEVQLTGICYDVCFHYNNRDSFVLTLCSD